MVKPVTTAIRRVATVAQRCASQRLPPQLSAKRSSHIVFGSREVKVTISGTGFNSETTVLFDGTSYTPSVNQAGTELRVTLATRDLAMGRYPITISNGSGMEITKKKGLTVF